MMIYLTSEAAQVLDKLVPYLPKSASEMTVAFIPTAGDIYEETSWQTRDRDKLTELGFEVEDVDITAIKGEALRQKLVGKDILFVAGGNTSYLLEKAQESGFIEITRDLVEQGTIYIGSSAGALLAAPNIEVDKIFDDGEFGKVLDSYDALGFVDFVPLPHADNEKFAPYHAKIFKEYGSKYDLRKLNDNEGILITDKGIETLNS